MDSSGDLYASPMSAAALPTTGSFSSWPTPPGAIRSRRCTASGEGEVPKVRLWTQWTTFTARPTHRHFRRRDRVRAGLFLLHRKLYGERVARLPAKQAMVEHPAVWSWTHRATFTARLKAGRHFPPDGAPADAGRCSSWPTPPEAIQRTVLYSFRDRRRGGSPRGAGIDSSDNLYGTTTGGGYITGPSGGGIQSACPSGCGTVFEVVEVPNRDFLSDERHFSERGYFGPDLDIASSDCDEYGERAAHIVGGLGDSRQRTIGVRFWWAGSFWGQ